MFPLTGRWEKGGLLMSENQFFQFLQGRKWSQEAELVDIKDTDPEVKKSGQLITSLSFKLFQISHTDLAVKKSPIKPST